MLAAIGRVFLTAFAAGFGYCIGCLCGSVPHIIPHPPNYPFLAEEFPLPHHVPEHPGGLSFRFAMAHDVIHERFPRHGLAHYRERERITREKLAKLGPTDPARFPLSDDLAAGLERLGKSDEAVGVMRAKLALQQEQGIAGRDLYTSFANLGTFLIHASIKQAQAGDAEAKGRFWEGVGFVHQSVEVNPEAHFGRERWQAAIAEFLLNAMGDPNWLKMYDCLGNRLDTKIEDLLNREGNWVYTGYGRPTDAAFSQGKVEAEVPAFFLPGIDPEDPKLWPELSPIRRHITKVGAEYDWNAAPSHKTPVPFDEPVLGIIGMWRQGGGANPHFALALGETMLRVGQRYIAWAAFERAGRMADRFWPDPALQQFLRDHCRKRQAEIEATLTFLSPEADRRTPWQYVSPPPDPAAVAELRSHFDKELAIGQSYQKAYQDYETAKIAAGVPITDEHFFEEFSSGRGPIASPTGPEEWFAKVPKSKIAAYAGEQGRAWGVFGAGVAAMATALLLRLERRSRRRIAVTKPIPIEETL